jgi:hypothetical protein
MISSNQNPEFSFSKAAVYKIRVNGDLSKNLSERLAGLQINVERFRGKGPISVLIGQINDQAALAGILNTLYELHLSIISVNMLLDNQIDGQ